MATVELHMTVSPFTVIRLLGAYTTLDDLKGQAPLVTQIRTADGGLTTVVRRAQSADPVRFIRTYTLDIQLLPAADHTVSAVLYTGATNLVQFIKDNLDDELTLRDNESVDHTVKYTGGLPTSFDEVARGSLKDEGRFTAKLTFENVEAA